MNHAHKLVEPGGPETGPAAAAVRPDGLAKSRRAAGRRLLLAFLLGIPAAITLWGLRYYAAPAGGRVRSDLHALLRPSGTVGLALGIAAFALFLFLWLYPLRKHVRWLAWTGAVGEWLDFHIVAGIAVPVLAAVHAGWRFDGLIGLGYLSMLLVAISGIVGRYLYTRVPRRRTGLELTQSEAAAERRALLTELAVATGEDPRELETALALPGGNAPRRAGFLGALAGLLADDRERARAEKELRRRWQAGPGGRSLDPAALRHVLQLARRELALAQQVRALDATHRAFALWHVFHRPFAVMAFLAVAIHVVVAIVVGGVRVF